MLSVGQKRTFARPAVEADPMVPFHTADAIQRINCIRQSLSGVVSSRASSAERHVSPRPTVAMDSVHPRGSEAYGSHESAASVLLLSTQRRVEELLREKHLLERRCVEQEDELRHCQLELMTIQVQSTQSERPSGRVGAKTPSLNRRSRSAANDITPPAALVPVDVQNAVASLLEAAMPLLPPHPHKSTPTAIQNDAKTVKVKGKDDKTEEEEWCTMREVIRLLMEEGLPEWERLRRECAKLTEERSKLKRQLRNLGESSLSWGSVLVHSVLQLQDLSEEQQRVRSSREQQASALREQMTSLNSGLAKALEDGDTARMRCVELERALCMQIEQHAAERRGLEEALQRAKAECAEQSGRLQNPPYVLETKTGPMEFPTAEEDESEENTPLGSDPRKLQISVRRLSREREALCRKLESRAKALAESKAREEALDVEKNQFAAEADSLSAELAQVRRQLLNASSSSSPSVSPWGRLDPLVYPAWNETLPPVTNVSPIVGMLDADLSGAKLYDVGSAMAWDAGICENADEEKEWSRFAYWAQSAFTKDRKAYLTKAASGAQFFYAMLKQSGMMGRMNPTETAAALMAAICFDALEIIPRLHGVSFQPHDVDALRRVLAEKTKGFSFDQEELCAEMEALLLDPHITWEAAHLAWQCRVEMQNDITFLDLPAARRCFARAMLWISRDAFAMQHFAPCESWAHQVYNVPFEKNGPLQTHGDRPSFGERDQERLPEAQIQRMDCTVKPLCDVLVTAFPPLSACEVTLRRNRQLWEERCPKELLLPPPPEPVSSSSRVLHSDDFLSTVKRGWMLVECARFISNQDELKSLWEENATLRDLLAKLLQSIELARERESLGESYESVNDT